MNKLIKYFSGFIFLLSIVILGCETDSRNKTVDTTTKILYASYQDEVKRNVISFSEEEKEKRNKNLQILKDNTVYKKLIDSLFVTSEYIPVINAISNGMTFINEEGFAMDQEIVNRIEKTDNSKEKMEFVVKTIGISQPQQGGLTNELINLFERYKNKFNYYGEPSTLYGANGTQQEKISYNYDFSSVFGILDSQNKNVLNAIYEAKQKGYSIWNKDGEHNYIFNHIATFKGYNKHVKKVYPKSPYVINADIETTALRLFNDYEANEISADENYKNKKIAVTGIIEDIGNDILDNPYVSLKVGILQNVNCYFNDKNKKEISKLRKGQKVTIIGICEGKSLNIMVLLSDCKIWK